MLPPAHSSHQTGRPEMTCMLEYSNAKGLVRNIDGRGVFSSELSRRTWDLSAVYSGVVHALVGGQTPSHSRPQTTHRHEPRLRTQEQLTDTSPLRRLLYTRSLLIATSTSPHTRQAKNPPSKKPSLKTRHTQDVLYRIYELLFTTLYITPQLMHLFTFEPWQLEVLSLPDSTLTGSTSYFSSDLFFERGRCQGYACPAIPPVSSRTLERIVIYIK